MLMKLLLLGWNQRYAVVTGIVIITVLFLAGLPRLEINTGLDSLIPASNPDRLVYQRVLEEFGTDDKVIVYISDQELWTPQTLASLRTLHEALTSINGVTRVESLFSQRVLTQENGTLDARPAIVDLPQTTQAAELLRDELLQNPLVIGDYLSADGMTTAMLASIDSAVNGTSDSLYHEIENLLDGYLPVFDALFQTGSPRLNSALRDNLYQDFTLLGPLSALVLLLSILLFMRSTLAAVIPLLTSAVAIIWTFGMLAWTGIAVNILSAMLPSLIIVIAATTNINMVMTYIRGMDETEEHDHSRLLQIVARQAGLPMILTLLTVMLGFGSNIFNDIGLIRDFAITSTFAVLVNGIVTVLLLPVLLGLFKRASAGFINNRNRPDRFPGKLIGIFRQSQEKHSAGILVLTTVLCLFFFYHASTLYVTNDPVSYFPESHPLVEDINRVQTDLAGINTFFITLESNTERAFLEPRNIGKLADIQQFMQEQGAFDQSRSIADYFAFIHQQMQGDQLGRSLPRTRQLVAQYALLFHRNDIDRYISHDFARANIIVRHNINDSRLLNEYINELRSVVNHIAGPDLVAHIVGQNLMINRAADSLQTAQINALLLLATLIFIIMSLLFTSIKGGLIVLIPAVIPIALMFGIMGLLSIPLNPGTAMVAVIAIGLAVDGTIHLVTRYNELCRRSSDYSGAVHQAVSEVAPPLIISSLALALGFGILIFSSFTVVAQFGALVTATLLFSIFANLVITPLVLKKIRLVGLYQILSMRVDDDILDKCILFRDMTEYQRRKAILISELHEFKHGELLIEQDTVGRSMYLILTGEAEVIRRDGDKTNNLAVLTPGQVFGEIGYVRETRRTADVRARTDISALKFDYERLQKDLKYFPHIVAKLNFNISHILGQRLADMVEQTKA